MVSGNKEQLTMSKTNRLQNKKENNWSTSEPVSPYKNRHLIHTEKWSPEDIIILAIFLLLGKKCRLPPMICS
jgi:hypothetical protein